MNKVEISSSWENVSLQLRPEEFSIMQQVQEEHCSLFFPSRFLFDSIITDILQCFNIHKITTVLSA